MHARDENHEKITQGLDVIAALRARLDAFVAENQAVKSENARLEQELKALRIERDLYKERVLAQARALFAAKSEERGASQRDLFFNEAEALAPAAEPEAKTIQIEPHTRVQAKRGRKPLDPALPREVVRHELPEAERVCAKDGAALREIGLEVSEQLDIIPAQVRVIRHERVKYACPCCAEGVRIAPAPAKLIPKGLLSESALAWVITAKFQDGLPLYRQAALLNRFGGDVVRNTLAHGVVRVGAAVQPVVNLMRDVLLEAPLILGDETELQVLKEDGRPAQSKSWLWLQMSAGSGPPVRLFTYSPSRSAKTAIDLYAGASGKALLSDGYEAYAAVARANRLTHLGCWAHARRRFVEAEALIAKNEHHPEHPATRMIGLIAGLYAIEQRVRDMKLTPEAHLALRARESSALIAQIEAHLHAHLHAVVPQSLLGKALHYLAGEWPKLVRFLEDASWPLDNNLAENAIRPFVVGRKNWLFADTVAGAQASANLYSLIETAKANRIEPYHYLRELFTRLPRAGCLADYEALLPWNIGKI